MNNLTGPARALLDDIARRDDRGGAVATYTSHGRYKVGTGHRHYARQTFRTLFEAGLVTKWDSDTVAVRLTDAGRTLRAELAAKQKAKKPKAAPNAESPAAQRALRALAAFDEPITPHRGHRRGMWSLGRRDGYTARAVTFYTLVTAGYARTYDGPWLSIQIEVTAAGRQRLDRGRHHQPPPPGTRPT